MWLYAPQISTQLSCIQFNSITPKTYANFYQWKQISDRSKSNIHPMARLQHIDERLAPRGLEDSNSLRYMSHFALLITLKNTKDIKPSIRFMFNSFT